MRAHQATESRRAASTVERLLTWLGGGHWGELGERYERSTHAVAGAIVLCGALLACLVAGLAVGQSARWPVWAITGLALVFGLLVGAVTRGIAGGPGRGVPGALGRGAVAVAVGVIVGELASLVMFSGSIDRRLDEQAALSADSTPAVAQATASLARTRDARTALDGGVERARGQLDNALVVARCEYHPTPGCPQTRITGVPGAGPETRTANELLDDARRDLDNATATRDREAPRLDALVARGEQALAEARHSAIADSGRGLGDRWVALNDLTLASVGVLLLRLLTLAIFALLYLLPLFLRRWRGETTHDRQSTARADRERAELEADTAIAIKRAEVRREAEIMWAEHQLTQARLAIEAQLEIDREQQRRRVVEALEGPERPVRAFPGVTAQRTFEPVEEDMYLPIAAEAEAASRAAAQLPAAATDTESDTPKNLPAPAESGGAVEPRQERAGGTPLIPSIPDATRAAARWIRPLVPPFVARAIDNTTQPLRTARQVFEEVEEIAFSLKRTRKVTVNSETSDSGSSPAGAQPQPAAADNPAGTQHIPSWRDQADSWDAGSSENYAQLPADDGHPSLSRASAGGRQGPSLESAERDRRRELIEREGPRQLRSPDGPRQLPPAE
ncbi:hypothetical protein A9W99_09940 [Mycobacterium sp. 1164966.3]|uniref:DUF4407 domain-containing protein n=1 Tax=Mycobacterium sp. 1164966.3 TaxID=1856861 RepID=UPI0007FF5F16|nr:DUF4407 domain-containing protein [Mycobacterium sp. 1164966.3]OBA82876.1 hypothetical protein A9W99_09940 [Mycobacterium sp. 1164966.3]